MKDTGHVTEKMTLVFFDFLGVFHRFNINIRIEVHFFRLHWEMKGQWSRVNLWEALRTPQDLHETSVLSFPDANEKKCTSILYKLIHWKIFTQKLRPCCRLGTLTSWLSPSWCTFYWNQSAPSQKLVLRDLAIENSCIYDFHCCNIKRDFDQDVYTILIQI